MPPKQKIPAPIDRPLSRAYLREFSGWSTAYPPGLSDPTSLRVMENVMINRDGAAQVRPGMRLLLQGESAEDAPDGIARGISEEMVGSHEVFFREDGTRAYLFAVRTADGTVGFRVSYDGQGGYLSHTLEDAGFSVPAGAAIHFSSATTYVKFLQIDNKVFALSDAGETMRMFYVGEEKKAQLLSSIERPEWTVSDKLVVVHPTEAWINDGVVTSTRRNLITNPSMAVLSGWTAGPLTGRFPQNAGPVVPPIEYPMMGLAPQPTRMNFVPNPSFASNVSGWSAEVDAGNPERVSSFLGRSGVLRFYPLWWTQFKRRPGVLRGPTMPVFQGSRYYVQFKSAVGLPSGASVTLRVGFRYRWFSSSMTQIGSEEQYAWNQANGAWSTQGITLPPAPAGATFLRIYPFFNNRGETFPVQIPCYIDDVMVTLAGTGTSYFDGSSGTGFRWQGAANNSISVYQPATDVSISTAANIPLPGVDYTLSAYMRLSEGTSRQHLMKIKWLSSSGSSTTVEVPPAAVTGTWTRYSHTAEAPSWAVSAEITLGGRALEPDDFLVIDNVQLEQASTVGDYFDGDTENIPGKRYSWTGTPHRSASLEEEWTGAASIPLPATPTTNTLISSSDAANTYNYAFFYSFSNEVGESAASQVTVIKAQRRWNSWSWTVPNAASEPSTTPTSDPALAADQLVAYMPADVFSTAMVQGARSWSLYMMTWSNDDPVPVTALLVGSRELKPSSTYASDGWIRVTGETTQASEGVAVLPTASNRFNFSDPSRGGQGLVAADRMVLVKDPTRAAVIKWSSAEQGYYTDFSASRGGGYKTLTSGNLFVPAAVKLWQNPQSVDTLTILCMGTDGYSTGYYMAPSEVTSQSETTMIMGFEETTATPGTTSPYGCEVLNNALYHPLDDQLMKSTANNYSIHHKSITDQIRNRWEDLRSKEWIVSSQYDNRLYYIVHNPYGEPLEEGCKGNEIWVFDAAAENGTWSRFLIQAVSLRKMDRSGRVYMSVIRPDGIFYLDPTYPWDDYVDADDDRKVKQRAIPWQLETNTQGANRAHDAWAHLQQVNPVLGNFIGAVRYGVRGIDVNGKMLTVAKVYRDERTDPTPLPYDIEDFLRVGRDLKEWFFFASSVQDEDEVTELSFGQISQVQYRYTPSTVNTGYEFGSVETFEYGRGNSFVAQQGVPETYVDRSRA